MAKPFWDSLGIFFEGWGDKIFGRLGDKNAFEHGTMKKMVIYFFGVKWQNIFWVGWQTFWRGVAKTF